jgi:hypothetical protein
MRDNLPGPGATAAAALVLGGGFVVALPQHALSVLQVVILTVAVGAGLHALSANVPPTGWMSPFKWMSPFRRKAGSGRDRNGRDEIDSIRSKLGGRRQQIRKGPALPPETVGLLRPLIRKALDLDPEAEAEWASARSVLSPRSWSILTAPPPGPDHWFRALPPNRPEVAGLVHAVLDEVDRILETPTDPFPSTDPRKP